MGLCGALTGLAPLRLAHAPPVAVATGTAGAFALGIAFAIATGGWSADADLAHPREALHRNPVIGVGFGLTGGVAAFLVFVLNQDVLTSAVCALAGALAPLPPDGRPDALDEPDPPVPPWLGPPPGPGGGWF